MKREKKQWTELVDLLQWIERIYELHAIVCTTESTFTNKKPVHDNLNGLKYMSFLQWIRLKRLPLIAPTFSVSNVMSFCYDRIRFGKIMKDTNRVSRAQISCTHTVCLEHGCFGYELRLWRLFYVQIWLNMKRCESTRISVKSIHMQPHRRFSLCIFVSFVYFTRLLSPLKEKFCVCARLLFTWPNVAMFLSWIFTIRWFYSWFFCRGWWFFSFFGFLWV